MASERQEREPIPTRAAKNRIHSFAEHVASQMKFEPGDAIEPIISQLGGRIAYHTSVGNTGRPSESIVVESNRKFTIFIPSTTSPQRDRFTIAHELGHFFLHFPMVQKVYPGATMVATRWVKAGDVDQQRAEWEANWFAAAFLMPEASFRKNWSHYSRLIPRLATKFDVSEQAVEVRAKSLELQ